MDTNMDHDQEIVPHSFIGLTNNSGYIDTTAPVGLCRSAVVYAAGFQEILNNGRDAESPAPAVYCECRLDVLRIGTIACFSESSSEFSLAII